MLSRRRVKFGKVIITTLKLSMDSFSIAAKSVLSTASPQQLLTCSNDPGDIPGVALKFSVNLWTSFYTMPQVSIVLIRSNIPSLPIRT